MLRCRAERFRILKLKRYLVRVIVSQATAQVGVAPGKGLTPCRWNQNFILLYSQYALVSAHDLSHRLLELWKEQQQQMCDWHMDRNSSIFYGSVAECHGH